MSARTGVGRSGLATWVGFVAWTVIGAAATFGLIVYAVLAIVPVAIIVGLAARTRSIQGSWYGVLVGIGSILLLVAYLQRRGPGTVCWHTATASGCDEYLNPWPFLVAGITLVAAGFVYFVKRRREQGSPKVPATT
jgi:LPXTG-motif cell wall-anchored protein